MKSPPKPRAQNTTIDNYSATGPFGSLLHKSDYVAGGTPVINPINLVGGKIVVDAAKTVSSSKLKELANYRTFEGDVLLGRRGEMGRCATVTRAEHGWLCGTGCFILRSRRALTRIFSA